MYRGSLYILVTTLNPQWITVLTIFCGNLIYTHGARNLALLQTAIYLISYAALDRFESLPVVAASLLLLHYKEYEKTSQCKSICGQYLAKLERKQHKLTNQNRFIATLTHEMRNVVTRFVFFFFFGILFFVYPLTLSK